MSSDFRMCAIVPSLNAAATVEAVIKGLRAHVETVIVIDDGSTDDTAGLASSSGAIVVRHASNRGKGVALRTGLSEAAARGFSHAVTLDSDGQHSPEDLPKLAAAARSAPSAVVIGARDFTVDHVPGASRFGREFSNFWVWLETGSRLSDTQSGFRIYPVGATLALGVGGARFQWEVEIIVRARWSGIEVLDVPISVYYPPPEERVSNYRGFYDSTLISLMHCRLVARTLLRPIWPVRRLLPLR